MGAGGRYRSWRKNFANFVEILNNKKGEKTMSKYVCDVCGWVYDEEEGVTAQGIAPGTKFENLPDDFVCELCGVGKESFSLES